MPIPIFPTRQQFRRWGYLSKFGFVSFFVGTSIGLVVSIVLWLFPDAGKQWVASLSSPGPEQALVGTWKGATSYRVQGSELVISGYTRLLNTGHYNYSGEVELRMPYQMTLRMNAQAAGTWKASGNKFVLTASDVKTLGSTLTAPGKPDLDFTDPGRLPKPLPRLEDLIPRGSSQEYVVVELTPKLLRATSVDVKGVASTYEALRQ